MLRDADGRKRPLNLLLAALDTKDYAAIHASLHTVEARLARWILQTHDRLDGEVIPLTQEFLSEMLAVRRTTITSVAQKLQDAGAIRYSRGRIVLEDRPALEKIACECYGAIRKK